jgi:glycosyltransferase involved in cell wall biosynthesis
MTKDSLLNLYQRFITFEATIVHNVNRVDESKYSKRALLVYLVKSFLIEDDDPLFLLHHNLRRCRRIATILGEFGYVVDVADGCHPKFEHSADYDLIISDRADLADKDLDFRRDAIKIFLATSDYHKTHNESLRIRHRLLSERRKCEVTIRRIYPEDTPFVLRSNAIMGVGNEITMNTWREVFEGPIYPFNNCGYEETIYRPDAKDFESARRNFLFFASLSQVQKGLDLLLEIFPKHPELHLYVCSPFETESDFCACYYKELYETPNIHPIGWVTVNSAEFYDLIERVAYVVHPTCSEGQPSSVVQCMYAGLIPLVTKEAGINTDGFGVTFSNDSLEEIEKTIVQASRLSTARCRARSIKTRKISEERFSESALMNRWRNVLSELLQ